MVKGMLKSSPWQGIQWYYQGKVLFMVVSIEMPFLRKRWCCATGAKLSTWLARISLLLHPTLKILARLSLNRVIPLERIWLLCNLNLLSWFSLLQILSRHPLLLWRRLERRILRRRQYHRRKRLTLVLIHSQSQVVIMTLHWNLLLSQELLRRIPLACLLRRTYLLFRSFRLIRTQLHGSQSKIYS